VCLILLRIVESSDEQSGRLALVFELMQMNIYELIRGRKQYLKPKFVKLLMFQLITAVAHMHKNRIFHRDIKPENVLVDGQVLKVADFGSCRGIYTNQPFTEYISTRWYRAPECLLTNGYYDYKMDIWGIGCVMFEIISLYPLFPGKNELDQIDKVHAILGSPPKDAVELFKKHSSHVSSFNFPQQEGSGIKRLLPHADADCVDLICLMLTYNPEKRITAKQALKHPYFREIREAQHRERIRTASPTQAHRKDAEREREDGGKEKRREKRERDKKKEARKEDKKFPSINKKVADPAHQGAESGPQADNTSSTKAAKSEVVVAKSKAPKEQPEADGGGAAAGAAADATELTTLETNNSNSNSNSKAHKSNNSKADNSNTNQDKTNFSQTIHISKSKHMKKSKKHQPNQQAKSVNFNATSSTNLPVITGAQAADKHHQQQQHSHQQQQHHHQQHRSHYNKMHRNNHHHPQQTNNGGLSISLSITSYRTDVQKREKAYPRRKNKYHSKHDHSEREERRDKERRAKKKNAKLPVTLASLSIGPSGQRK